MQPQTPQLLDQVRDALRLKHYSYKTEDYKDIDFGQHQIVVRDSKDQKSRVTPLPALVAER